MIFAPNPIPQSGPGFLVWGALGSTVQYGPAIAPWVALQLHLPKRLLYLYASKIARYRDAVYIFSEMEDDKK